MKKYPLKTIYFYFGMKKELIQSKQKPNDTYGAESEQGYLEVTMPRNRLLMNTLFMRLLERFPNIFLILQYILYILGLQ